jgi:membrane protein
MPSATAGPPGVWRRTEDFFTTKVWQVDPERLPRARAFGYHVSRVLYAGIKTFLERELPTRAAALTYYTVLSLVPFLAFAFSMVKGLGAYDLVVDRVILPRLHNVLDGNPQLLGAIDKVFAFVSATDATSLGALGAAMMAYTSVGLVRNVASGLNALWGAPDQPFLRAVRDYIAIIVLAPLLLTVGGSLLAAATASSAAAASFLREELHMGFIIDVALALTPLLVAFLGLFVMYIVLPNLRVRARSAAVGAAVGCVLWYGALFLYVRLQMGVAGYNALYAGFAALPVFLVWIYISWLTVLVGGGVAAGHQNTRILVQQMRARGADVRFCEALAANVISLVGRSFLHGERRWTRETLAAELDVSDQLVEKVLSALEASGLVVKAADEPAGWVLGRDPDTIRVRDVIDAVGRQPITAQVSVPLHEALDPRIRAVLDGLDHEVAASPNNVSLRELVACRTAGAHRPTPVAPPATDTKG